MSWYDVGVESGREALKKELKEKQKQSKEISNVVYCCKKCNHNRLRFFAKFEEAKPSPKPNFEKSLTIASSL